MRSRPTLINRTVAALSAAALVVLPAPQATADRGQLDPGVVNRQRTAVPGLTESDHSLWKTQESLDQVIEDVRAYANSSSTGGFSGAVVDTEGNAVSFYWKGAIPRGVSDRVSDARKKGITVVVQKAPYTEAELLREANRISQLPLFRGARTGQRMMRVGPRADGTGLDVGLYGLPSDIDTTQARPFVPALETAIPLTITRVSLVTFATRGFDGAPNWGGSYILNRATSHSCTSAFGVIAPNSAIQALITAAHCGEGQWGSLLYRDESGNILQDLYGSTFLRSTQRDVQLIRTSASAGVVYWGEPIDPPNNYPGTTTGAIVGGDSANNPGDRICLSGSFTGTLCDGRIRIYTTNLTITYDPPFNGVGRVTNLATGAHDNSETIVGQGDSGGPVVSVRSDGKLAGRGVISGQDAQQIHPCVGFNPPGRRCSSVVYFADLRGALSSLGVQLQTR